MSFIPNSFRKKSILESLLSIHHRKILLFILLSYLLLIFLNNILLISDELFFNSLGEQLSYERIRDMIEITRQYRWIGYVSAPLLILLKLFFIAVVIYTGVILFDYKEKISFKQIFRWVVLAEIIFVIAGWVKFAWFYFSSDYTLQDIQYFYPLSAAQFFRPGELYTWLVYPFQVINVFEIAYLFVLAYGLKIFLKEPLEKMLKLVLSSYGVGLLVWVVFVMFLTLNYS